MVPAGILANLNICRARCLKQYLGNGQKMTFTFLTQ